MRVSGSKIVSLAVVGLALRGAALAQAPGDIVSWTVSVSSADTAKPGDRLELTVRGAVEDGWHLYASEQLPGGPIPLRVTVEPGVAAADGAPAGSQPTKVYDPSFRLETRYYSGAFTLTAPVRVGSDAAPGPQQIPVSVRFQTCNGKICHPPKTVRLSAPINVRKAG
jgi:Disulphide bond corrector protein DsbC